MTTYSKETALYDTGAIANGIEAAGETASKYLTVVSGTTGISVHNENDNKNFVNMNADDGVTIYRDIDGTATDVARFGDSARIGKSVKERIEISDDGIFGYNADNAPFFKVDYDGSTVTDYLKEQLRFIAKGSYRAEANISVTSGSFDITEGMIGVSPLPSGRTISGVVLSNFDSYEASGGYAKLYFSFPNLSYGTSVSREYRATFSFSGISATTTWTMTLAYDGVKTVSCTWGSNANTSGPSRGFTFQTITTSAPSFAFGSNSDVNGGYASSFGRQTQAVADYQFTIGRHNDNQSDTVFEIGNGTSDSARSNALTVDWNGGIQMYLDSDGTSSSAATSGDDMDLFNAIYDLGWYSDVIV